MKMPEVGESAERVHASDHGSDVVRKCSRRDALKKIFVGVTTLGALPREACADEQEETVQEQNTERSPSYTRTILESNLLMVGKVIATNICNNMNIPTGNVSIGREEIRLLNDQPVFTFAIGVGAFPLGEEFLFRGLPSWLCGKDGGKWGVGVLMTALFAYIHSVSPESMDQNKFTPESVPIAQFMAGIYYWYLVRKRGLSHSILAHQTNNSVCFAVALAILKIFPEKGEDMLMGTVARESAK